MVDLTRHKSGITAAMNRSLMDDINPRELFCEELVAYGFVMTEPLRIGSFQRIKAPLDRSSNKKSGWYIYQEIETSDPAVVIGIGTFGSFKGEPEKISWVSKSKQRMTFKEQSEYSIRLERAREAQEAEKAKLQSDAADRAVHMLELADNAASDHSYLKAKGIKSKSLKQSNDVLLVPVYDDGEIVNLQRIYPDGSKKFLYGGKIKGCYHVINGDPSHILVCEGYATGQSLHEATGYQVYISFSCNNLYEVSATAQRNHPASSITICADNDQFTDGNPGITKATQAADGLSCSMVYPSFNDLSSKPTDFNDLHQLEGIDKLKSYFITSGEVYQKKPDEPTDVDAPAHGVLRDIYNYYNATSGNDQRGFAIQTALAVASIVLSRRFCSEAENFTSLFFINVAKSGTGKEHIKTIIERVLQAADMGELINGDGYTSGGAVLSSLLFSPRHITVIDEMGRYLEATGNNARTNNHLREANTRLMEAIGRCHSVMRPQSYSTMTLTKDQASSLRGRFICNPAITLVGMSTPSTLFKSLTADSISDGFINRFVISISNAERTIREHKPFIDVPDSIIKWIEAINERAINLQHDEASEPVDAITLSFSGDAYDLQREFQQFCIECANDLEQFGMEELPSRSNEMAMRIALIAALAENPQAESIKADHMEWAIKYIKNCLTTTIKAVKLSISGSDFESHKKQILSDLRKREKSGITWKEMQKNPPYSHHRRKDLQEILTSLQDAELADCKTEEPTGRGRPAVKWFALN